MKGFFVAGTDTGVGKTEIGRALCTLLRLRGMRPLALKPVETGCEREAPLDALALREACGGTQSLDEVCPYRFRLPAAPLVAAEAEGAAIDLQTHRAEGRARSDSHRRRGGGRAARCRWRAVGQGDVITNLDFARRLRLPVVLVGRAGLGTLNHCALKLRGLKRRGLVTAAIVLNRTVAEDDPSVATNKRWVTELTGARVLGPGPFVADAAIRPDVLAPFLAPLVH